MSKKTSRVRLQRELKAFTAEPPPFIPRVHVNESNILEWHLLLEGLPDTPYAGGWYVAKLKFAVEYPFKPPSIFMCTPSGRFATGTRLCLSMSDFHPELWNPGWTVATVAKGLLSFMVEDTVTTGAVTSTDAEKRAMAAASVHWNLTHGNFKVMFPDLDGGLDAIREPAALGTSAGADAGGKDTGGAGDGDGDGDDDAADQAAADAGAATKKSARGDAGVVSSSTIGGGENAVAAADDALGKLELS